MKTITLSQPVQLSEIRKGDEVTLFTASGLSNTTITAEDDASLYVEGWLAAGGSIYTVTRQVPTEADLEPGWYLDNRGLAAQVRPNIPGVVYINGLEVADWERFAPYRRLEVAQ